MNISFREWLFAEELTSIVQGPFLLYHGATTGPKDSYLKSFQRDGALPLGHGHGQGGGFFVRTDPNGIDDAKKHAKGRSHRDMAISGSSDGSPMVVVVEVPQIDFNEWDYDIEIEKVSSEKNAQSPIIQLIKHPGNIEKLKKLGKAYYKPKTKEYFQRDFRTDDVLRDMKVKRQGTIQGYDLSNPTFDDKQVSFNPITDDPENKQRIPKLRIGLEGDADMDGAPNISRLYQLHQDANPTLHHKLEAWWFNTNYGKKSLTIKYTGEKPLKVKQILVLKGDDWVDETIPKEIKEIPEECKRKYWGISGAGILPFCEKTKRFLPNLRSAQVMQPNTYGIFGGGILFRDLVNFGIKSHEELLQTPKAFEIHAKKELEEESGFSGSIKLENLFIYKDDVCDFHYYNFLGIVREEFNPQAQKDSEWETTGKDRWVTYNELIELEPKHFGLTALIKNAGEKLKAISEKVSEPILSDEEINKNYLKQLNSQY